MIADIFSELPFLDILKMRKISRSWKNITTKFLSAESNQRKELQELIDMANKILIYLQNNVPQYLPDHYLEEHAKDVHTIYIQTLKQQVEKTQSFLNHEKSDLALAYRTLFAHLFQKIETTSEIADRRRVPLLFFHENHCINLLDFIEDQALLKHLLQQEHIEKAPDVDRILYNEKEKRKIDHLEYSFWRRLLGLCVFLGILAIS